MPRVQISLPEELGAGSAVGHTARNDLGVTARTDGSGDPEPVIVRWFETWATGRDGVGDALN